MSHKYSGGCDHIKTHSEHDPIDNHTCHCSVCKSVTGQATTHVAFFNHADVAVNNEAGLKRQPFNANNPDGPLELCTCGECGTPIMLNDKQNWSCPAYVPVSQLIYAAFRSNAKGLLPPSDE